MWRRLAPHLPANGQWGGQWRDHRQVIGGILWKLRNGAPWCDLPARFGPWQMACDRLVRWRRNGTWDAFLVALQAAADAAGEVGWTVFVDATIVRAHRHAAGARRRPSRADIKGGPGTRMMRRWTAAAAD